MRITSGQYRSRRIQMPAGIRPTQDKVRKALFDILGDIEGLSFLELFAGSGAVGFEAASRGARDLTLVELNRACLLAIEKNIDALKIRDCNVCPKEADDAIKALHKNKKRFDIIFLDPPYYQDLSHSRTALKTAGYPPSMAGEESGSLSKKTLQTLSAYDILTPSGLVIAQHFKKDNLPDALGDLALFRQAHYGDTVLSFYRKAKTNVPKGNISGDI